jgi:hypothetical protein
MLIDWHTNLNLPEHYTDPEGQAEFTNRVAVSLSPDPASHRKHIAERTDKFVVVTMRFDRLKIRVPNEFTADYVRRFPGRAKGFACVDPLDDNAPRDLEFAIKELGLHGLKISPVYGGYDPWCAEAWRIYETCDRLNIPLLWHQSAAYAAESTLEHANPILLDKIARTFPKLRMIVAHLGQPWMAETVVLLRKHPQLMADLSARFHRPWQLYQGLMLALDYKVTDQLLFGSDFPLRTTEQAAQEFRALNTWPQGVTMPPFPAEIIEDIILNRPFERIWPEG